jgi:hypothetical protein
MDQVTKKGMFPFPPFYLILPTTLILPRIYFYLNVHPCKFTYLQGLLQGLANEGSEKNVILEKLSCVLLYAMYTKVS